MKLLPLLFLLAASTFSGAQAPTPIAAAPAPSPVRETKRADEPGAFADPSDPNSFKFTELTLGKGENRTLGKVVDELATHVRRSGGDLSNVLFGPGAEQVVIPSLTLRNVNGIDALQMLVVSAECTLEQVISTESGRVIGWKIHGKTRAPSAGSRSLFGSGMAPSPTGPAPTPATSENPVAVSGFGAISPFTGVGGGGAGLAPSVQPTPGVTGNFGFGGSGAGMAPGGQPTTGTPGGSTTSVYSLGSLVDGGKTEDLRALEDSLKLTLDSASLPEEKPKLSLHEKTRLLVVKGGQETQQLVGSFLEALIRNRTSEKSGEAAEARAEVMRIRDSAEMKINETQKQMARMEQQIDNLEKERSVLVRRNEELEAKLSRSAIPADTGKK